jgi:two-component system LytT family sensor kinase
MKDAPESNLHVQDVEVWLTSPWRRVVLAVLATLAASAATTVQVADWLAARGREFEPLDLFLQQLCVWAPWGLVGAPIVYLARWVFRWRRSWAVAALIQAPLSLLISKAFQLYEDALANVVFQSEWLAPARAGVHSWFRLTRELLVYWLILSLGAAVYAFLRSQREARRAAELALKEAELRGEVAQARLDTLESQLHPHFLFNALNSVGGLVREGETKRALSMLSSIANLLRGTLDQSEVREVELDDELELVERYLEIERVRFGARLEYAFDVGESARTFRVPTQAVLTLVENAVRHGVSPREGGGRITIRARLAGQRLRVEVEDDGPGFPRQVLESSSAAFEDDGRVHIGLANTRRRLELMYGERQTMRIENAASGGALVAFEIGS